MGAASVLHVSGLPESGMLLAPSGPQMTRRIGNSLGKLLTRSAVETAVGLAGDGGGRGWMVCTDAGVKELRGGSSAPGPNPAPTSGPAEPIPWLLISGWGPFEGDLDDQAVPECCCCCCCCA